MTTLNSELATAKLNAILASVTNGDSEQAITRIDELVGDLKLAGNDGPLRHPCTHDHAPEPWRLISAHLKAAEVEIEATHLAPATENIEKALYVAMHGSGQEVATASPEPGLDV